MRRFGLVLLLIGGSLAYFGYQEYRLGADASPEPVDADLAKIEAGEAPPDVHVRIGLHHELFHNSVFSYEDDGSGQKPSSPVEYTYCPIISDEHPAIVTLRTVEKKYGSLAKAPKAEKPKVTDFAMLIKTRRYDTIKNIPNGREHYKSVTGLIVNEIESLSDEEKKLLRGQFPKIDFDKVLILETGREPTSRAGSWAMMIGGGVVALAGLALVFRRSRRPALPVEKPPEPAEPTARETAPDNPYSQ